MGNFTALEYWKGFRRGNGKMAYGLEAVVRYTIGYITYHHSKRLFKKLEARGVI